MDRFLMFRRRLAAAALTLMLLPAAQGGGAYAQPVFFSLLFPQLMPEFDAEAWITLPGGWLPVIPWMGEGERL